jgi:hypothetical protein
VPVKNESRDAFERNPTKELSVRKASTKVVAAKNASIVVAVRIALKDVYVNKRIYRLKV